METYARYSAWQVPLTTPAGYSFLGNLRCFVKLSFVYRAWFAIPAARDTRNTQLLFLLVVSWQYRILRTCWMSKTFADCNLNWAVPGWPGISSVLWLGILENFAYFRRTLEVSNKCRDSDLAWLKFRACKYCNECHGSIFFKILLRWRFKVCLLISNTRMFRYNGDLENGVLKFKRC